MKGNGPINGTLTLYHRWTASEHYSDIDRRSAETLWTHNTTARNLNSVHHNGIPAQARLDLCQSIGSDEAIQIMLQVCNIYYTFQLSRSGAGFFQFNLLSSGLLRMCLEMGFLSCHTGGCSLLTSITLCFFMELRPERMTQLKWTIYTGACPRCHTSFWIQSTAGPDISSGSKEFVLHSNGTSAVNSSV